jgi:hypothetical protein
VADAVAALVTQRLHSEVRGSLRAYRIAAQREDGAEDSAECEAHAAWRAALEHVSVTLRLLSAMLAARDFRAVCRAIDSLLDGWFHEHMVRTFARGAAESQLRRGASALIAFTREAVAPEFAAPDSRAALALSLRRSAPRTSDTRTLLNLGSAERATLFALLSDLAPVDDMARTSGGDESLSPEVRQMAAVLASGYQVEHLPPRDALHLLGVLVC